MNTISRYKIDTGTPQQASEMQYPFFSAEKTGKVKSANSVCDVATFVAYWSIMQLLLMIQHFRDFIADMIKMSNDDDDCP